MEGFKQDLIHAVRIFLRNKAFAIPALLTLGLGIGVTTAVFSLVYGILLRPLPYRDSSRLVRISEFHPGADSSLREAVVSNLTFEAWRREPRTLEGVAAYSERAYTVTGSGDAERLRAAAVSPTLFSLLGVSPVAGRFFEPDEGNEGADGVVVLAHDYWQERFGSNADAIGRTITLDDRPRIVIGVAPPGFSFPDPGRRLFTPYVMPRQSAESTADRQIRVLFAIGRLKPSVTIAQAETEGTLIARGVGPRPVAADLLFGKGGPVTVRVRTIADQVTTAVRPILLLLTLGVTLVLLIGCANVSNLLLTRGVARSRELAVRAAIGAGYGQVLRQLLIEGLLLSVAGGVFGLLIAWNFIRLLPMYVPRTFPRLQDVRLDWEALIFAVAISLLVGALASIVPALRGGNVNLVRALREGAGTSADTHNIRFRRGLLVVEAAFAVLLLAGATLLTRGFTRLLNTDTGYDAANVLTARISLQGIPNPERWQQLATAVLERLRSVPGVGAAGAASMAPLGDSTFVMGFHLAGDRPVPVIARALGYVVTPGYAETLHLRLRQGRLLAVTDIGAKTQAIVVNEEFVKTYLNDGQPVVGRQYANMLMPNGITEIVGVVGNVLKNGLIDTPRTEFYVALGSQGVINVGREINLLVRTAGDPRSFADTLRQAVREVDRNAPVHNINVLAAELSATAGEARFATIMLGAFAALAVGLAAIGLYGVLAYGVTSRRREIGVRLALGASRANLFALVMREGIGVTCAGLLVGLWAAAALTRLMRSLLFGIDSLDVISFMAAPLILIVVALCACLLPAWRASSIDPLIALRHE